MSGASDDSLESNRILKLSSDLRQHKGEFVLVVEIDESKQPGTGGCFGPDYYYNRECQLTLGMLADGNPLAAVEKGLLTVGFTRYYGCASMSPFGHKLRNQIAVHHGPWRAFSYQLDRPVIYNDPVYQEYCSDDVHLRLVIGDEAVGAWFDRSWPNNELDRLFRSREHDALWYQQAAEALGRPLDDAPELQLYKQTLSHSLLQRLWDLHDELRPYVAKMKSARKAVLGTGIMPDNGAISLMEDEDDLRVLRMSVGPKIDRIFNRMKATLEELDSLGCSQHPYVITFRMRYFSATGD